MNPPKEADCVVLDQGRLRVSRRFLSLLQRNGLNTFEKIMACDAGQSVYSVSGRATVRLELNSPAGPLVAYLKRYSAQYLSPKRLLLRLLRWPGSQDEAWHEWRMLHLLPAHGIPTAVPIAVGGFRSRGVITRSFVMTEEIRGGVPGDRCLPSLSTQQRRQLIPPLADFTRQFHDRGFIHKDYYIGHIFVTGEIEHPGLFLIDLQRVLGPGRFRERWLVKDLGELAYSALQSGASRADLLRFYRARFGKARLDRQDKRLIRKILSRVRWLFRRTPGKRGGF